MLIRMTVGLCGPTMTLEPGDEREFPQDEAVRLIAAGFAVPVVTTAIEIAVADPVMEVRDEPRTVPVVEYRRKGKRR
jgi:hypothetical protein